MRSDCRGMTIIELMATMAIMFSIGAAGTLSYTALTGSFKESASRNQFESDLNRAKNEALNQGTRVVVQMNDSGTSYTVGLDFLPFDDPAAIETTLFTRDLPSPVAISPATDLIFDSRAFSIDSTGLPASATLYLQDGGVNFSRFEVAVTGVITVYR